MNLIPHTTRSSINTMSINRCFVILGAPHEEVFTLRKDLPSGRNRGPWKSIYERYCKTDLLTWATWLRKEKMKLIHPDRRGSTKDAAVVNAVYDRVVHILSYHPGGSRV